MTIEQSHRNFTLSAESLCHLVNKWKMIFEREQVLKFFCLLHCLSCDISEFYLTKCTTSCFISHFVAIQANDSLALLIWHIIRIQWKNFVNLIYQPAKIHSSYIKVIGFSPYSIETKTTIVITKYHEKKLSK